jgi:iron complex transport system ATP-binding protein
MRKDIMGPSNHVVCVEQVSWRRSGRTILHDISWNVKEGEHWALIGLNGSGKTSLLNLITGYEWPSTGQIDLLGHRLGRVELKPLRQQIGWVSAALAERYRHQDQLSAREVVLSGKFGSIGLWDQATPVDVDQAEHLLAQFHVAHRADFPFQLLSSGEKQKVLLARAWMAEPKLIILDEPCTGLDLKAREELLASLNQLGSQNGPTLIYVSHHIEEIMPCFTHALLLKEGSIVAQGPKEEVLTALHLSQAFGIPIVVEWHAGRPWVRIGSANFEASL